MNAVTSKVVVEQVVVEVSAAPETARAPGAPLVAVRDQRRIVLLRQDGLAHGAATSWALALSKGLGRDVVVVRQLRPERQRVGMLFPESAVVDGLGHGRGSLRSLDASMRWVRRYPANVAAPLVTVEQAGLGHLAEVLQTLDPMMIVVPAGKAWGGDRVAALAAQTGAPVLAARQPKGAGVLAASSLEHEGLPVLRAGARYAQALHRPLAVAHNIEAWSVPWPSPDATQQLLVAAAEQERAVKLVSRLEVAASALEAAVQVTTGETAEGVMTAGHRANADLLVVGCPGGRDAPTSRLTARVVDQAVDSSVLVVPIPGEASA